jgi:hypothetical protein
MIDIDKTAIAKEVRKFKFEIYQRADINHNTVPHRSFRTGRQGRLCLWNECLPLGPSVSVMRRQAAGLMKTRSHENWPSWAQWAPVAKLQGDPFQAGMGEPARLPGTSMQRSFAAAS